MKLNWPLLGVVLITMMLLTAFISDSPSLSHAAKKSSSSSSKTSKASKPTSTSSHVKGVKVLRVHTVPSTVAVGNTFNLRATVVNNSTTTITFDNGTCISPLSVTFDKNAVTEPHLTTAACKSQTATLKPGGQSPILNPNLSGKIYRATAPGATNATLIFKYGAVLLPSKSHVSDSTTRVYTFNILPIGTTKSSTSLSSTSSRSGSLTLH
jgi:hypothetical protein